MHQTHDYENIWHRMHHGDGYRYVTNVECITNLIIEIWGKRDYRDLSDATCIKKMTTATSLTQTASTIWSWKYNDCTMQWQNYYKNIIHTECIKNVCSEM